MNFHASAITGSETIDEPGSPYAALVAFYQAFNKGDLSLMARNWSQTEEASMSNPLGGVKRGWPDIQSVYTHIFNGPAQVYVEYYDYSIHQTDDMFCAVGRERGYFRVHDEVVDLDIRTTRFFRRERDGWRQLHHHGSIDRPELLDRYQTRVRQSKDASTQTA